MKRIISLIIVLTMCLSLFSFNSAQAEDEVIFSESFEKGLANWNIPSGMKEKFVATTEDATDGKASLKIIDETDGGSSSNYYGKKYDAVPGGFYTISADIKVIEGKAGAGMVYLRFNDKDGKPLLSKAFSGDGNSWTKRTATYEAPQNAAYVLVILASNSAGTGTVLIDNLKVTMKQPVEVSEDNKNAVFFDSFENGVSGWNVPANLLDKFVVTTEDATEGKQSLKMIDEVDGPPSNNYYGKKTTAVPGAAYTISADIKVIEGKAGAGMVYLRFNDKDGKPLLSKAFSGDGNSWIKRTATYQAPSDAAYVLVILASNSTGTGTVLIDNLKVTMSEAKEETPLQGSGSGFENPEDYKSEALKVLSASQPLNLGSPLNNVQILGCHVEEKENGDVIFHGISNGTPAKYFAFDVNSREITDTKVLETADGKVKASRSYAVDMGKDGTFNIPSNTMFFRYNPATKELKSYPGYFGQTEFMSAGYVDENDNYYFGTYPDAKLIKYDKAQDKLIDLGKMVEGKYVRAIAGIGDYIYIGGLGAPAPWAKYNIKTGEITKLKTPSVEGVFTETDVENFYSVSVAGKYIVARCKIATTGTYYGCIYDTEKEAWTGFIPKTVHLHFTGLYDGLMYFHTGSGSSFSLYTFNPETNETKKVENTEFTWCYIISPKLVTLKDQANYPGKTLVGGAEANGIVLINLETGKREFIKSQIPASALEIRLVKSGINSELVVSPFMGEEFVVLDTKTDKFKYSGAHSQMEDVEVIDNKYYFGKYGSKGAISEFDPITRETPVQISYMEGSEPVQDRIFTITDGKENIIYGSYPYYGYRGGAIAVYNKSSKTTKVYSQPVKDQCIAGIAYKNGKIYASTAAYAGLGIDPIDEPAHILKIDAQTGTVEKDIKVELKTDTNKQYFAGDMIFDADGNLWVGTRNVVLKVNPETLEITKEIPLNDAAYSLSSGMVIPFSLEFGPDGLLYTNVGFKISAIDTKTEEVKILSYNGTNSLTVSEEGHLYYKNGKTELGKLMLSRTKEEKIANDGITLFIGSPNALVKGQKTLIDKGNDNVVADTVDGRTLVPVRFIAENYGAEVLWDEATETVTLKMTDKTVKIVLNKNEIDINGQKITIDVPAKTFQDRTMLPLRAFVEKVMGKTVFWDNRGLIVITDKPELDAEKDLAVVDKIIEKIK